MTSDITSSRFRMYRIEQPNKSAASAEPQEKTGAEADQETLVRALDEMRSTTGLESPWGSPLDPSDGDSWGLPVRPFFPPGFRPDLPTLPIDLLPPDGLEPLPPGWDPTDLIDLLPPGYLEPILPPDPPIEPEPVAPSPPPEAQQGFWSKVAGTVSQGFTDLSNATAKFGHDILATGEDLVLTAEDAIRVGYDAVLDPSALPAGLEHLRGDGQALLSDAWATVKDVTDETGRELDWVINNIGAPAAGWVDEKFIEPAAQLMEQYVVEPANSAIAGAVSAALGIPKEQVQSVLESGESSVGEFVKGFATEGVDIAKGVLDMFTKPGETIENMAKLGYMIATEPHATWDAFKSRYEEVDGPERAGMIAADVLSLFIPGSEAAEAGEAASIAARGAEALGEVTKSMATSMEGREAALTRAVSDAEAAVAAAAEGTAEREAAENALAQAHADLAAERAQHLDTVNDMKDTLVEQRDNLDTLLADENLTAEERASLEAARAKVDEGAQNLASLEQEALQDHLDHLESIEAAHAPSPLSLSASERLGLERVAAVHEIEITPFERDGELNFALGRTGTSWKSSRSEMLDDLREVMPDFEVSVGQNVHFDDLSDVPALLEEAGEVQPTIEPPQVLGLRGGAVGGLAGSDLQGILAEGDPRHITSLYHEQHIPVTEYREGVTPVGQAKENAFQAWNATRDELDLMDVDDQFYSVTIQKVGDGDYRVALWPTTPAPPNQVGSEWWLNRLGGHFQLAKLIGESSDYGGFFAGGGVRFNEDGTIAEIYAKSGLNGVGITGDKTLTGAAYDEFVRVVRGALGP